MKFVLTKCVKYIFLNLSFRKKAEKEEQKPLQQHQALRKFQRALKQVWFYFLNFLMKISQEKIYIYIYIFL
jgi:hypothetical protein